MGQCPQIFMSFHDLKAAEIRGDFINHSIHASPNMELKAAINSTIKRFTMKGFQTFKQDRQDGPKGGVITLLKNDITASEIKVNMGDVWNVTILQGEKTSQFTTAIALQEKNMSSML
ncbi:hypothetical protein ElyMa_004750200 [Elysia marginata]|uniref:Uncharacterized protein n=1 Tax=Elysia marginata TaxID=1093978 RepID=A0AAV4IGH2_9GAST|nr:hypothetical protein ElyMa_004750200 [Elysia marginata]